MVERVRDIVADAVEIESLVKMLSFPRFFGTPAEEKARDCIKDECKKRGIPFTTERFEASRFFMCYVNQVPYFVFGACLLVFIALLVSFNISVLNIIFAVTFVAVAFGIEEVIHFLKYPSMYSRFADIKESENIILPPVHQTSKEPKTKIFLVAHTDSKSEKPDPHVHFTVQYISILFGTLFFSIHVIVYSVFDLLGITLHPPWIFLYGLLFSVLDMLRISTAYFGGESPGANDDAIGVSLCIMLQKYLKSVTFNNVDVTMLLSGAEEVGEIGTHLFLKRRLGELDRDATHFVVLDGLASHKIMYFTSRGFAFRPFSPLIASSTRRLLRANHESTRGLDFKKLWMPPPANTDHSGVVNLNYHAFVFASPEGVSHTTRDTFDRIDYIAMARFLKFLVSLLVQVDIDLG